MAGIAVEGNGVGPGHPGEFGMGPVLVVIASVWQKAEQRLAKQLIAQAAVEVFDEPVLLFWCGLCWRDVRDVLPRSISGKRLQNSVGRARTRRGARLGVGREQQTRALFQGTRGSKRIRDSASQDCFERR